MTPSEIGRVWTKDEIDAWVSCKSGLFFNERRRRTASVARRAIVRLCPEAVDP